MSLIDMQQACGWVVYTVIDVVEFQTQQSLPESLFAPPKTLIEKGAAVKARRRTCNGNAFLDNGCNIDISSGSTLHAKNVKAAVHSKRFKIASQIWRSNYIKDHVHSWYKITNTVMWSEVGGLADFHTVYGI